MTEGLEGRTAFNPNQTFSNCMVKLTPTAARFSLLLTGNSVPNCLGALREAVVQEASPPPQAFNKERSGVGHLHSQVVLPVFPGPVRYIYILTCILVYLPIPAHFQIITYLPTPVNTIMNTSTGTYLAFLSSVSCYSRLLKFVP